MACSSCAAAPSELLRCSRCRSAFYCSAACQRSHWPAHKSTCHATAPAAAPAASLSPEQEPPVRAAAADSDVWTLPNDCYGTLAVKRPDISSVVPLTIKPLRNANDGGHQAVFLRYSGHLGRKALYPHLAMFGVDPETDDTDPFEAIELDSVQYAVVSVPVYPQFHDTMGAPLRLKDGEWILSRAKFPYEAAAMYDAGLIVDTGRFVEVGYYGPLPIVRFVLPRDRKLVNCALQAV